MAGLGIRPLLVDAESIEGHLDECPRQLFCVPVDSVGLGVNEVGLVDAEGKPLAAVMPERGGKLNVLDEVLLPDTGGLNWWLVGGVGGVMKAKRSFFKLSRGGVVHRSRRGMGRDMLL